MQDTTEQQNTPYIIFVSYHSMQGERRDRLRKLLAQRDAEIGDAPAVGQIVLEQETLRNELFYTEGSELLQISRRKIAQFSLQRAAHRLQTVKRRRQEAEVAVVRTSVIHERSGTIQALSYR
jgi:hypothetical protein